MKQMINYEKVGKEKLMFFGIFSRKKVHKSCQAGKEVTPWLVTKV
jgi:hypothetical protein